MALPATTAPTHAPGPVQDGPNQPAAAAAPRRGGFSFSDLLDIVNPLQHIPVVSTLYRAVTGDEIKAPARLLGGGLFGFGLFGGLAGLAGAAANSLLAGATGKDAGGHVLALLRGGTEAARPSVPAMSVAAAERSATKPLGADASAVAPLLDLATRKALAQSVSGGRPLLALEPPARAGERERAEPVPASASPLAGATPAQAERAYGQALAAMQAALDRYEREGGRMTPYREHG